MEWMNLPPKYCTKESKFVILPISYEKNLTYGDGTSKGPHEIIKASQHLEYYDEQFDCEGFTNGIKILNQLELCDKEPEEMVKIISERIYEQKNKFVISLGGIMRLQLELLKD